MRRALSLQLSRMNLRSQTTGARDDGHASQGMTRVTAYAARHVTRTEFRHASGAQINTRMHASAPIRWASSWAKRHGDDWRERAARKQMQNQSVRSAWAELNRLDHGVTSINFIPLRELPHTRAPCARACAAISARLGACCVCRAVALMPAEAHRPQRYRRYPRGRATRPCSLPPPLTE
jgi:hypothetical protein